MIIKTVSRSYSRSINTLSYGGKESWVKIESTYSAECESGDDPTKVSAMLGEQCQKDVADGVNLVITKVHEANAPKAPVAPAGTTAAPRQL